MKHILYLLLCFLLCVSCTKELEYHLNEDNNSTVVDGGTVRVFNAGDLKSSLPSDYMQLSSLTIEGELNGSDMIVIREMAGADVYGKETNGNLESLNIKNVSFVSGGDAFFYYNDEEIYQKDNELSRYAFGYCKKLKDIILPTSIKKIASQAFFNCEHLEALEVPKSVETIGRSAFYGCNDLESVYIPDGITTLEDYLFGECYSLKELRLPETIKYVGYKTFYFCSSSLIDLENSLPNLENFEDYAFSRTKLKSFIIPKSMNYVPSGSFYRCEKLTSIELHDGIDSIGALAFYNCPLSGDLKLPKSLKSISHGAYYQNEYTSLEISSDIKVIKSDDLELYSTSFKGKNLEKITINEGVNFLELEFAGSKKLNVLKLSSTMKRIGRDDLFSYDRINSQFAYCTSLESVQLPESLEYIASRTFNGCSALSKINIPKNLSYLGSYAFCGTAITSIEWNSLLTTIPQGVFENCISLESFNFPSTITEIDYEAFNGCSSMKNITLPENLDAIGVRAFANCSSLTEIRIPASVTSLDIEAFSHCEKLTKVVFDEGNLTTIPSGSFLSCSNLLELVLPRGLKEIDDNAFANCGKLMTVNLPEGVISLGHNAFSNDRGLKSIYLPSTLSDISSQCFKDCINLTEIKTANYTPQTLSEDVFANITLSNVNLYIPKGTANLYKSKAVWKDFKNIIEY